MRTINVKTGEDITNQWKSHVPNLFKEILLNKECWILAKPLQITAIILGEVAEAAIRINDPELHLLMCRLTLYGQADPTRKDEYDPKMIKEVERRAAKSKKLRLQKIKQPT